MVQEGTVLRHRISARGIEVDKEKIEAIEKLPPPSSVKGLRSFLGHAGFYRRLLEYTKEQQLYRNLVLLDHTLLTFCIRIGTFDCFRVSGLV